MADFLKNNCEKNSTVKNSPGRWKYVIHDEKLGNSIFLFYEMSWKEAMQLLKRGTINVILLEVNGSVEYHFDPMNPDAQLTYLKLGDIIGKGEMLPDGFQREKSSP